MEITEKERLMLVEKKEAIRGATLKILELVHEAKNSLEIEKNFQFILEGLSTIASYSDSKNYDLNRFTLAIHALFATMTWETDSKIWVVSPIYIEQACIFANSVRFDFTKKRFKLVLPKNLNFGSITNK